MDSDRNNIQEIKAVVDIVKVILDTGLELKPTGKNYAAICPFHVEEKPSFTVDPERQRWKCFGACGKGGDVIDFIMEYKKCSIGEALRELAGIAGIKLSSMTPEEQEKIARKRINDDVLTATAEHYHQKLTGEAKSYITNTRGITEDTIGEYKIGFAPIQRDSGDKGLSGYLQNHGYTIEQAIDAGVLYDDGREYFAGNIVFPNWNYGKVVYITGRGYPDKSHKKPLADKIRSDRLFLEQPSRERVAIIAEGETDTYTLKQAGFNAWGIYGTNSFNREWAARFKNFEKVVISLDGDEAGIKAAMQLGELLGEKARIVVFPDGASPDGNKIKDWNELFTITYAKDIGRFKTEYSRLLDQAQTPLEFEIHQIPSNTPARDIPSALAPLISKVASLSEVEQDFYTGVMASHLESAGVSRQSLKKDIKQAQKGCAGAPPERILLLDDTYTRITPAQDFIRDTAIFTVPIDARVTQLVKNIPIAKVSPISYLVNSNRELVRFNSVDLLDKMKIIASTEPVFLDNNRWSLNCINRYIEGKEDIEPFLVFQEIQSVWETYFEFKYPYVVVVLSLWTIGTYIYRMFETFPYVAFVGERGSGKSKALLVAEKLCFNALLTCNITPSLLFRIIEGSSATLLIDEAEYFKDPHLFQELRLMLNSGYKRGGKAHRVHPDTMQPQSFDIYSGKMIANIKGLEEVLESRCILFPMLKAKSDNKKSNLDISESGEDWGYLRHLLYSFSLIFFRNIRDIYMNDMELKNIDGLSGRSRELWRPLLAIAKFMEQSGCEDLFEDVKEVAMKMSEKAQENGIDNWTTSILLGLRDVTNTKEDAILNRDILDALTPYLEDEEEKPSARFIGSILKRFDLVENRERTNHGYQYFIKHAAVEDVIERYNV